ncbi:MAG: BrnA antitoxin family protein [Bdellovibrio sp.]|nr:BrnA antitoxin family protein [Bdellovibrio sp.]
MKKKQSASSAHGKRAVKSLKYMPDSEIDFSDIPEMTTEEIKRGRRVGRPKSGKPIKRIIAIRIDPSLLAALRKMAIDKDKPYQTLIHELLEKAMKKTA